MIPKKVTRHWYNTISKPLFDDIPSSAKTLPISSTMSHHAKSGRIFYDTAPTNTYDETVAVNDAIPTNYLPTSLPSNKHHHRSNHYKAIRPARPLPVQTVQVTPLRPRPLPTVSRGHHQRVNTPGMLKKFLHTNGYKLSDFGI